MKKLANQSSISSTKNKEGIMTNEEYYSVFDQMIEDLQADNREGLTKVISSIMNLSMRLEQEKAIQASHL